MPPKSRPSSSHSSRPSSSRSHSSSHRSSSSSRSSFSSHRSSPSRSYYSSRSYSGHSSSGTDLFDLLFGGSSSSSYSGTSYSSRPTETYIDCEYCGCTNVIKSDGDRSCKHCGASLNDAIVKNSIDTSSPAGNAVAHSVLTTLKILVLGVLLVVVFGFIFGTVSKMHDNNVFDLNTTNNYETYDTPSSKHQPVYVSVLERSVPWNDEYETYYDENTDCYFFKNYDLEPPIWQYWFEGISTPYDEYGWMEYDFDENCWYIQTNAETWEKYTGPANNLWHMNENE